MNPLLDKLHPYPFERLRALNAGITPNAAYRAISLGIGEPKHAAPKLIEDALMASLKGLSAYPATAGELVLRESICAWIARRYGLTLNPAVLSTDVGSNQVGGVINYGYEYDNRPSTTISTTMPT